MAAPPNACQHHRGRGPLVCPDCSSLTYTGSGAASLPDDQAAALQRYLQQPVARRQVGLEYSTLYRQQPNLNGAYQAGRVVPNNDFGTRNLPNNYPYATELEFDMPAQEPVLTRRPAVQQLAPPERQPTSPSSRYPEYYQPSPSQTNGGNTNRYFMSNGTPFGPQNYQPSPYQPNGVSTNGPSMPNGTYPPAQSSRRQQPSAEYYQQASRPRQDGSARSYRDVSSSMTQSSAINRYIDEYYEDSSDEERERQRRRRRGRR